MSTALTSAGNGAPATTCADLSHLTFLMHPALALLWQARELATEAFGDPDTEAAWAFAPQGSDLIALGLSEPQLRLLIVKRFVGRRGESNSRAESNGSRQQNTPDLIMLSATGAAALVAMLHPWHNGNAPELQQTFSRPPVANHFIGATNCASSHASSTHSSDILALQGPASSASQIPLADSQTKPHYDKDRRELWYHGHLVKRYKTPAKNQELILLAFEEEGWPANIDDPLPPCHSLDPKLRLRDTITSLNRTKSRTYLAFSGDGTGTAVIWHSTGGIDFAPGA